MRATLNPQRQSGRARQCVVFPVLLATACGSSANDDAGAAPAPIGVYREIAVEQPNGGVDSVWVYAAALEGNRARPVVVYARGQGAGEGYANSAPGPADRAFYDTAEADAFARLGYFAVAFEYRNHGSGAPLVGEIKYRDHDVFDARTVLSVAQWAVRQQGNCSPGVAFVGHSMGTWPTLWAVTEHPALVELQAGLDIRTAVLAGETANHLSNIDRYCTGLSDPNDRSRTTVMFHCAVRALTTMASELGMLSVRLADLEPSTELGRRIADLLTPDTIALVRAGLFVEADTRQLACDDLSDQPALCFIGCLQMSRLDPLLASRPGAGPITARLTPAALEALAFWEPPAQLDPGPAANNPLLGALRSGSPALAARAPLRTSRVALLLSDNDYYVDPAARQMLLGKLEELGVVPSVPAIATSKGRACEHADYFDAARPECGFSQLEQELAAAVAE